eukprot:4981778-Pyramimonas_sp.AAC.1
MAGAVSPAAPPAADLALPLLGATAELAAGSSAASPRACAAALGPADAALDAADPAARASG